MPDDLPNNLRLKILRNEEILEKSQSWLRQSLVRSLLSRNKTFVIAAKITKKQISKCFSPFHFCLISLLYPINFIFLKNTKFWWYYPNFLKIQNPVEEKAYLWKKVRGTCNATVKILITPTSVVAVSIFLVFPSFTYTFLQFVILK